MVDFPLFPQRDDLLSLFLAVLPSFPHGSHLCMVRVQIIELADLVPGFLPEAEVDHLAMLLPWWLIWVVDSLDANVAVVDGVHWWEGVDWVDGINWHRVDNDNWVDWLNRINRQNSWVNY